MTSLQETVAEISQAICWTAIGVMAVAVTVQAVAEGRALAAALWGGAAVLYLALFAILALAKLEII